MRQRSGGKAHLVDRRVVQENKERRARNAEILKALSADLQNTGLEQWQQERIVKNYVLQFHEFRELTLLSATGAVVATSRIGPPRLAVPDGVRPAIDGVSMSPIRVDDDLLPTTTFRIANVPPF